MIVIFSPVACKVGQLAESDVPLHSYRGSVIGGVGVVREGHAIPYRVLIGKRRVCHWLFSPQELLKELEKFAFQGCGKAMTYDTAASGENVRWEGVGPGRDFHSLSYPLIFQGSTEAQRLVRIELMEKLRNQLDDIEKCAKEAAEVESEESGDQASGGVAEGSAMVEKQRIIIEELRKRFDFQFGDLERLR
jgi:hypothetical protein